MKTIHSCQTQFYQTDMVSRKVRPKSIEKFILGNLKEQNMSKVQDKMGYMFNSKCLKGYEMKHNNLVSRILNKKSVISVQILFLQQNRLLTTCRLDMSKNEEK